MRNLNRADTLAVWIMHARWPSLHPYSLAVFLKVGCYFKTHAGQAEQMGAASTGTEAATGSSRIGPCMLAGWCVWGTGVGEKGDADSSTCAFVPWKAKPDVPTRPVFEAPVCWPLDGGTRGRHVPGPCCRGTIHCPDPDPVPVPTLDSRLAATCVLMLRRWRLGGREDWVAAAMACSSATMPDYAMSEHMSEVHVSKIDHV
eukprot:1068684-Pelagomonas_calceolata.AAC.3